MLRIQICFIILNIMYDFIFILFYETKSITIKSIFKYYFKLRHYFISIFKSLKTYVSYFDEDWIQQMRTTTEVSLPRSIVNLSPFSHQISLLKTTTALGSLTVSTTYISLYFHWDIVFSSLRACTWRKMSYCEGCILYVTILFKMIYTEREKEREGKRDP